jgi:F-type H+-transporting ATPase subunit b
MFLSVDGTFFIQLINFAIFFAILNVVFLRPVGKAVAARRAYIESVTEDYDRYQAEGTALKAEAQEIRVAARREAEQGMSLSRAEASNKTADVAAGYAQQASEIVQESNRIVNGELAQARADSQRAGRELADMILQRAIPELAK